MNKLDSIILWRTDAGQTVYLDCGNSLCLCRVVNMGAHPIQIEYLNEKREPSAVDIIANSEAIVSASRVSVREGPGPSYGILQVGSEVDEIGQ